MTRPLTHKATHSPTAFPNAPQNPKPLARNDTHSSPPSEAPTPPPLLPPPPHTASHSQLQLAPVINDVLVVKEKALLDIQQVLQLRQARQRTNLGPALNHNLVFGVGWGGEGEGGRGQGEVCGRRAG